MALFTGTTMQTLAMLQFLHCSQNWSAPEAVAQNSSSAVINLITGTVNKVSEFGFVLTSMTYIFDLVLF